MTTFDYEFCVMHQIDPDTPHRGPWTLEQCNDWINEWIADGGREGSFYIAYRLVGSWKEVD